MNVAVDYALTFEDWSEAQRLHRARVAKAEPLSFERIVGGIGLLIGIGIFLAIVSLRQVPNSGPLDFFIDPTIPALLIPHACLAAFMWFLARRNKALGKTVWLIYLGLAISAAIVAYNAYVDRQRPAPPPPPTQTPQTSWETYSPLLSWVFVFIGVWIAIFQMLRSTGRSDWESSPSARNPVHLTINATSIQFEQKHRRCEYQWSAFLKFRQSANLFVLYTSPNAIEVIPRRAFGDPPALDDFEQLLRSVVPAEGGADLGGKNNPPRMPPPRPVHVQPLESRDFM